MPAGRRGWRLLAPLTALAAGMLFATSASTAQGSDLRAGGRHQLVDLIARERSAISLAEQTATELRTGVDQASASAAMRDARVSAARSTGAGRSRVAGLTSVQGPAVTVVLTDAPQRGAALTGSENPDDFVVHQQDVQSVVNGLWAGGAEAMSLMGQRIISTSAVRCVGNTVILHGRVYGPPFVITGIGDPDAMQAGLRAEPGVQVFRDYVQRFGLGYRVSTARTATLPPYEGPLELRSVDSAQAAGSGAPGGAGG